jgi:hypothetical protein
MMGWEDEKLKGRKGVREGRKDRRMSEVHASRWKEI